MGVVEWMSGAVVCRRQRTGRTGTKWVGKQTCNQTMGAGRVQSKLVRERDGGPVESQRRGAAVLDGAALDSLELDRGARLLGAGLRVVGRVRRATQREKNGGVCARARKGENTRLSLAGHVLGGALAAAWQGPSGQPGGGGGGEGEDFRLCDGARALKLKSREASKPYYPRCPGTHVARRAARRAVKPFGARKRAETKGGKKKAPRPAKPARPSRDHVRGSPRGRARMRRA